LPGRVGEDRSVGQAAARARPSPGRSRGNVTPLPGGLPPPHRFHARRRRSVRLGPGMRPTRRHLQRGIIVLPSAFTLGNLFLGFCAMISASRGQFETAAWLIVIAAAVDMLDGRIARFTSTGSEFGEQIDSLVDAISFGVAPAIIAYFLFLQEGAWTWAIAYIYIASAVVRLARFNVEQAGQAKANFHGLPSPTAGMTIATFYPFSQTDFFQAYLSHLPWNQLTV